MIKKIFGNEKLLSSGGVTMKKVVILSMAIMAVKVTRLCSKMY